MTDLLTLAARCEEAEGPSADLDADIYEALGYQVLRGNVGLKPRWRYRGDGAFGYETAWCVQKSFTRSVDSALALTPADLRLCCLVEALDITSTPPRWMAKLAFRDRPGGLPAAGAVTPALALCSAALKARHAERRPPSEALK